MIVLFLTIFVVAVIISLISFASQKAKTKKMFDVVSNHIKTKLSKEEEESKDRVCSYCGCKVSKDANDCPNCGAKNK